MDTKDQIPQPWFPFQEKHTVTQLQSQQVRLIDVQEEIIERIIVTGIVVIANIAILATISHCTAVVEGMTLKEGPIAGVVEGKGVAGDILIPDGGSDFYEMNRSIRMF